MIFFQFSLLSAIDSTSSWHFLSSIFIQTLMSDFLPELWSWRSALFELQMILEWSSAAELMKRKTERVNDTHLLLLLLSVWVKHKHKHTRWKHDSSLHLSLISLSLSLSGDYITHAVSDCHTEISSDPL